MSIIVNCPSCDRKLKVPDELLGKKVKCPGCATIFTAEEFEEKAPAEEEQPPRPRRPAREEEAEEERPSREARKARSPEDEYEEEEDLPKRGRRSRNDDDYGSDKLAGLSNNYSIDLGRWFEYAKAHYGAVLGPMIGYMLVLGLIWLVLGGIPIVNFIGLPILFFTMHCFMAGFWIVGLAQLKGKSWSFGDFFSGFQFFAPLFLNYLLTAAIMAACFIPYIVLMFIVVMPMLAAGKVFLGASAALGIFFANYVAVIYVIVRTTFFTFPLIIDRRLGPVEALKANWKLSEGHALGMVGVMLLFSLIFFIAELLCLFPILFAVPFLLMAHCAGYLLVAGSQPPLPSPDAIRRRSRSDELDDDEARPRNHKKSRDNYEDQD